MKQLLPLCILGMLAATPAWATDPLAKAIDGQAPKILEHLKAKKYENVGILKFLVRKGSEQPRDNAGDLNMSLANKVEVALFLSNTEENFGIIRCASQQVVENNLTTANHTTEEGRKAFFLRKYKLLGTGDVVDVSAFVTGQATISVDNKTMKVEFSVFDKTGKSEKLPGEIVVPLDAKTLAEAGYSIIVSQPMMKALVSGGPIPKAADLQKDAVEQALKVEEPKKIEKAPPFAPLANSPVKLTILYNNKPIEVTHNKILEPKKGDEVQFLLENPTNSTYAIVLMLNGENTLYKEKLAADHCRKWVLEPNTSVLVRGFQVSETKTEPFKVLSAEESDSEAVNYGAHAGTMRMVVYHGSLSEKPVKLETPAEDDINTVAIARTRGNIELAGKLESKSVAALKADYRGRVRTGEGARGLIGKSTKKEEFETRQVHFVNTTDVPVADFTLQYYKPAR